MNARYLLDQLKHMRQRLLRRQLQRSLLGRRIALRAWDPHLLSAVERLVQSAGSLRDGDELQLSITEAPRRHARRRAQRGDFVLPKFTCFELDTHATALSKDLARRWARCPASSYQVSVHRDAAAFDFFYH